MTDTQRKTMFALCRELDMDSEERRALINSVTGKDSSKELTSTEANAVLAELMKRKAAPRGSLAQTEIGMMTREQQKKAWALMFELRDLDEKPMLHENGEPFTVGERMVGAIKKLTGNNMAKPDDEIFDRVSYEDGHKLIEGLKRYVRSAKKKRAGSNV